MGRPAIPTAIKELSGSFKNHPERKNHDEPKPAHGISENPPDHLDDYEKSIWFEVVSKAPSGVLFNSDEFVVEIVACYLAEYRLDRKNFAVGKMGRLQAALGKLGLSPSDRAGIVAEKPEEDAPFGKL